MPKHRNRGRKCALLLLATVVAPLVGFLGCGNKSGVDRYELSGEITYDGKPVPKGYLRIAPDRTQGNSGPGSSATIFDGQYETMPKMGTVGGPHIFNIVGTDGVGYKTKEGAWIPIGRPLFPEYEVSVDLPKESTVQNFDVPVEKPPARRSRR